ncbi:MAG TPA: hypothetical protein VLA09_14220 [Longimicrobiales bacterium]|nr:hypothetical protein [Longimicrobiales bacterium]
MSRGSSAPGAGKSASRLRALGLGIVALGLVVRSMGFDGWWLNPDEGIYFDILRADTTSEFWEGVGWNAHPPLYYLMLRGIGVLTWDFSWFRALSLLSGGAAIYGLWLCGLEIGGRGRSRVVAGALAGLTLALSPAMVVSSQVMRPYALLLALLVFSMLALLRYLRSPRRGALVAYSICLAARYGACCWPTPLHSPSRSRSTSRTRGS